MDTVIALNILLDVPKPYTWIVHVSVDRICGVAPKGTAVIVHPAELYTWIVHGGRGRSAAKCDLLLVVVWGRNMYVSQNCYQRVCT